MIARVTPGRLKGTLAAIPSKSEAHRLLIAAALSGEDTRLQCASLSDDMERTAGCLAAMGRRIAHDGEGFSVSPATWAPRPVLNCGESGATFRFLLPVASALGLEPAFLLHGRLPQRPMAPLYEALEAGGVTILGKESGRVTVRGKLRGGLWRLPGHISSQFVSGLMLAAPLTGETCEIRLTSPLQSSGYARMTMAALKAFGIRITWEGERILIPGGQRYRSPGSLKIPGDWSNAAPFLCAAASRGDLRVSGLDPHSLQGDSSVAAVLRDMGADIRMEADVCHVSPAKLEGRSIDISDTPDLAPALALAALGAQGSTTLHPVGRLRLKESDRAESICAAIRSLGGEAGIAGDSLVIAGGGIRGGSVAGQGDHRIVMMAALTAVFAQSDILIRGAEAVRKSYPGFFGDLASLGVTVTVEE